MDVENTSQITATPAAGRALERLRAEHGDVILHVTDGCCGSRTPLCLKQNELSLGARDMLLGVVDGVSVYEMPSVPDVCPRDGAYLLDLVPGVPVGFSIIPVDGMRFALRETTTGRAGASRGLAAS